MRAQIRNAAVAFPLLIIIGFISGLIRPETTDWLLNTFAEAATASGLYQIEGGALMATLLINNLFSALMAIFLGLIPFLRLPALSLGLNGMLLGFFAAYYQTSGFGLAAYLAGTLPHGITEIAGLAFACGAGLYLCDTVTGRVLGRETGVTVAQSISECLQVYARRVVPLLFFSAVLETFVTPRIFALFF